MYWWLIFNNNFEIFQKQLDFLKNQVEILTKQITDRDELIDKLNKQVNELEETVNILTNDKKNLQSTICYDMNWFKTIKISSNTIKRYKDYPFLNPINKMEKSCDMLYTHINNKLV